MKTSPIVHGAVALAVVFGLLAPLIAGAGDAAQGITAVSSRVSKDYVRTKLPDGSFQPEEYAFGNGGRFDGPFRDASINKLTFLDVARMIAVPLKAQNYLPARDLKTEKLLIMLHWGTTSTPDAFSTSDGNLQYQGFEETASINATGSPAQVRNALMARQAALNSATLQLSMENMQRDQIDFRNASMLGYDSEGLIGTDWGKWKPHPGYPSADLYRDALIADIEESRYFVVLIAYDFQLYRDQKKLKALWETRFSIDEARNDFDKALPAMAQYASIYFGQDSHGLVRKRIPEGQVNVGEATLVEYLFGPKK